MLQKHKSTKGITLTALVVSIIVLIILAGVSVAILVGENGILTRASKAAILTEISQMEEEANLIYLDLVSKEQSGEDMQEVLMSDIAGKLTKKGYQIEQVVTAENAITGINLDSDSMSIIINEAGIIQVTYEGNADAIEYYASIKGKYYKMMLSDSGVQIDKTASEIQDSEIAEKLTATVTSGTNVTVEEIHRNIITLKAGSTAGTAVVTVSYGSYSKECTVLVLLKPLDEKANSEVEFNTDYGLVDVIWLSEDTNTYSPTPNVPDLYTNLNQNKSLTPVTWTYYENGTTVNGETVNWTEDVTAKSTWYNYTAEKGNDGKEDNTTSMWANAKNSDGSYFVWIPRYAYRITYYSDASYTNVTGYYDGYGMWKAADRKKKYDLEAGIETATYNGKEYIVHPAFMNDTSKKDSSGNALEDYERGGWDKNLTGIWVSKYEMSREGADDEDGGSGYNNITFLSVPGVQSARSIAIGNMYQVSLAYDEDKESHMLKASEWGAVAYLTQSQYGRNGHEIDINNSSITGNGGGSTSATEEETLNAYNTVLGAKASSTGNIYGIYDLSGGSWEYVAGYNKLGSTNRVAGKNYGLNMTKDAKDADGNYISTKYITAYTNELKDNNSKATLFLVGKVGDATKEVRKTSESVNWFSDNSVFVASTVPFLGHGGSGSEGEYAGIFYSDSTNGGSFSIVSFRLALGK